MKKLYGGLLASLFIVLALASPASAHEVLVTVKTECDKPTAQVTLQNVRTDLPMSFTSNVPISGIQQPVAARGTVLGTVPVQPGQSITLTVNATWPDGFKDSATATAPAPTNCTTTTTAAPTTTTTAPAVTTTVPAPTTTVVAPKPPVTHVSTPPAPPELPRTGDNVVPFIIGGVLLLGVGIFLVRKNPW